ncbi:hypothetical protein A3A21_00260 [Candidatus Jorgensenbacteria bacterium RIFCSPLOWO2_01_FULL_45_25b]|uniref:SMODS and SLOG-associating 2TM effector domain-containing protein n=1 Tax=Candidatus Jorgensenbacteria bacterium RIFCSPLOWO2_01_FULL_45_25b TaxID=1798471 RepID=A0A1F6BS13_9BACT|nr:MAG: hypothetical protein A3A21_00260 [Candidatus Jorgensenbacteria bacterium RIFCSPLOWO2_01_FULL_45_25b]
MGKRIKINTTSTESPFNIFEERKIELEKSKNMWRNCFIINNILLLCIALFAFSLTTEMGFSIILWVELALTLPLIYSAIFFHAQHNREREYLEEYSFKSMMARSLEAYRVLLKENINQEREAEQKKFLDFIIDSVKNLHTPPRAIISKHPVKTEEDIKVGVVEKLADVFKKFIP